MTVPQTTPLLLLSEYVSVTNAGSATPGSIANMDATQASRLRDGLLKASDYVQRICKRRFDERIETRPYTSLDERVGGDLLGPYDLQLDDDCKSAIVVTNGDGQVLSGYKLIQSAKDPGSNVNYATQVHLNIYGGVIWRSGVNDPIEAISVQGIWGYGGQWVPAVTGGGTQQVLTANLNQGATVMTVTDGTALEPGMVLKLVNNGTTPPTIEYLYVDVIPSTSGGNVSIGRAFNGSSSPSVAWASGTTLAYWQAVDTVRDLIRRLVQWKVQQIQTPVSTTATVGDFSFPVGLDGLPKDIYLML